MNALGLRLDAKGRLTPPKSLRDRLGFRPGLRLSLTWEDGVILLQPDGDPSPGAIIDSKGRIALPRPVRQAMGLTPGSLVLLRTNGPALEVAASAMLIARLRAAREALQAALRGK
jgi:AbrB family looped-hinge helix DNA binding protein